MPAFYIKSLTTIDSYFYTIKLLLFNTTGLYRNSYKIHPGSFLILMLISIFS